MKEEERFLVEVGIRDVRVPITANSRASADGQHTVASVSIFARIMREFEAAWIDRFIQILHQSKREARIDSMQSIVRECRESFRAEFVGLEMSYPVFVQKKTPVSTETCLVEYACSYSAVFPSVEHGTKVTFEIKIPCITTYPVSELDGAGGLLAQLSVVSIKALSKSDLFPEDLVTIVDSHALAPMYSFLTLEDQKEIIERVHSRRKTSVVLVDEIKEDLALDKKIDFYTVRCGNFGLLHSFSTLIATEKNYWSPWNVMDDSEL